MTGIALLLCTEIASAQTHAERALQELAAVREREQGLLQRRVEVLERQFREGVADLEQRFLLQARSQAHNQMDVPRDSSCVAPSKGPCSDKSCSQANLQ